MATLNLGRIKPVFRGAYNNSTAYVVDDIVTSSGSSYICIQASTGNAVSNATYWTLMAEGGDVASTLTTQGDILYRNGSGLARLGAGTNGQALITGGTGANPSWGTISSGTYSVHAFDEYSYTSTTSVSSSGDYFDIAGGNYVSFTPTSTDDLVFFRHQCQMYFNEAANGADVYLMMGTSTTIGSGDTKLNYNGQHSTYFSQESQHHETVNKTWVLKCTGLTVGSTYYVEQTAGKHNNLTVSFNHNNSNGTQSMKHGVQLIHYKKN